MGGGGGGGGIIIVLNLAYDPIRQLELHFV